MEDCMTNRTLDWSVWYARKKTLKSKQKIDLKDDKGVEKFLRAVGDNVAPSFEDRLRALKNLRGSVQKLSKDKTMAKAVDEGGDAGAALYSHLMNINSEIDLEKRRTEKAQKTYE